ncbi:DUF4113 domain-containing protein [Pseudomonas sp. F1_0610]|uniref:DUF4113 domain-containing protein n=1 Tax=Pseudomonas sp. F1_0610 TaxID=3114284 RepID=UPI0039C27E46
MRVIFCELRQRGEYTEDLFEQKQANQSQTLMTVLDDINEKFGAGTLRPGRIKLEQEWAMKRQFKSPCYTTKFGQFMVAKCE